MEMVLNKKAGSTAPLNSPDSLYRTFFKKTRENIIFLQDSQTKIANLPMAFLK